MTDSGCRVQFLCLGPGFGAQGMDYLMGNGTQHEEDAIVPRVESSMTTCRRIVHPDTLR